MAKAIEINGKDYERIIYRNEPVVTLPMVDKMHNRFESTARRNFHENKDQFIENEDYFRVPYEEWNQLLSVRFSYAQNDSEASEDGEKRGGYKGEMIFLTLSGYLMLAKTLKDQLAWDVQRILVRSYFMNQARMGSSHQPNPEYVTWLKEQRMSMGEERRFQEFALSEADRLFRTGGNASDLAHVPILKDAVAAIMRADTRAKQLGLFED